MPRPIEGSSVVITGASSGIGLLSAMQFARRGAKLTLAARQPEALGRAADACEELGASAIAVPTDVGDAEAVEMLATAAEEAHGGIDTWVSSAAVMAYGKFEQIPPEVFDRVIDTNLKGQVYCARAALERFRAQERGVLINISSAWGRITSPTVSPYVISKHGVRALTECLREELIDQPDIYVVAVSPQAVDTPIFDHAANYSGKRLRAVPPVYDPEWVAEGVVACAEDPRRDVAHGRLGQALAFSYNYLPWLYRRVAGPAFMDGTFPGDPAPISDGTILEPGGGQARGDWRGGRREDLIRAFASAARGGVLGLFGRAARSKP